jgi:hypothetical protein
MDMSKYKNKMTYPESLKKPILAKNPTADDAENFAKELRAYEAAKVDYNAAVKIYNAEEIRLMALFMNDLFLEYVRSDNGVIADDVRKKAEVIYAKAWSDGHSSGYSEVETQFADLVDFAQNLGVDV